MNYHHDPQSEYFTGPNGIRHKKRDLWKHTRREYFELTGDSEEHLKRIRQRLSIWHGPKLVAYGRIKPMRKKRVKK